MHNALMHPPPRRVTSESLAGKRLLESINSSASSEGGAWLSQSEMYETLILFENSNISSMYVEMTESAENEDLSRGWIRMHLELARKARASAPGGGEAP